MTAAPDIASALRDQIAFGADEAIGAEALDRFRTPPPAPLAPAARERPQAAVGERPAPALRQQSPGSAGAADLSMESTEAVTRAARERAADAADLSALRAAMEAFDLCPLKATATNLVFADGNPDAPLMLIGEAPGADEDRQGLPFVGVSGQLLDRMLASIGRDRGSAYITNILPWRPPGNRKPTSAETTMLLPFIRRHIALVRPQVLVFVGGTSAQTLTGRTEGITRLRGRWLDYDADGDGSGASAPAAMALFHPAYLLRSPARKREAWLDLLKIREKLEELAR